MDECPSGGRTWCATPTGTLVTACALSATLLVAGCGGGRRARTTKPTARSFSSPSRTGPGPLHGLHRPPRRRHPAAASPEAPKPAPTGAGHALLPVSGATPGLYGGTPRHRQLRRRSGRSATSPPTRPRPALRQAAGIPTGEIPGYPARPDPGRAARGHPRHQPRLPRRRGRPVSSPSSRPAPPSSSTTTACPASAAPAATRSLAPRGRQGRPGARRASPGRGYRPQPGRRDRAPTIQVINNLIDRQHRRQHLDRAARAVTTAAPGPRRPRGRPPTTGVRHRPDRSSAPHATASTTPERRARRPD